MKRGRRPAKASEYGLQLREKQKAKRMAGMREKQFHLYYERASRKKGQTGEVLLQMLECRLDNVVYQLSLTSSKSQARQLVVHRHVRVNNQIINRPSYQVSVGDAITLDTKALEIPAIKKSVQEKIKVPSWLIRKGPAGKIKKIPTTDDVPEPISTQDVVEFYSR